MNEHDDKNNSLDNNPPVIRFNFTPIYEFPHRAYLTDTHKFLDQDKEFNQLAFHIAHKRDVIFLANNTTLSVLLAPDV